MPLDPQRYFPADPAQRRIAAELFAGIEKLPIISPHGHTDPAWFASDAPFEDAVSLLLWPDHYLLRLLFSAGVTLESIGFSASGAEWKRPAAHLAAPKHYYIFAARPAAPGWSHFLEIFGLPLFASADIATP